MTKAEAYISTAKDVDADVASIMTALDAAHIPSDQDWKNEKTTWTFNDGSKIVVCGSDVETR